MGFYFFDVGIATSSKTKKQYGFVVIIDEDGNSFKQFIQPDEVSHYQNTYEKFDDISEKVSFRYDSKKQAYLPFIK